MATKTNIPTKATGDNLTAAEFNELNSNYNTAVDDVNANKTQTEAEAIQLLRLHDPDLVFQGFVKVGDATPTHTANHAWIATESGTIFGIAGVKAGQIIYSNGSSWVVEDIKSSVNIDLVNELGSSETLAISQKKITEEIIQVANILERFRLRRRVVGVTFTDGYIINGTIISSTISQYSSPIFLSAGETIVFRTATSTVDVISKTNEAGSTYSRIINQPSQNPVIERVYTYTAPVDIYVALCGRKENFSFTIINEKEDLLNVFRKILLPSHIFSDFEPGYFQLNITSPLAKSSAATSRLKIDVEPGDFIFYFGARDGLDARSYAITNESNVIIERAAQITETYPETRYHAPYLITIPAEGKALYLNIDNNWTDVAVYHDRSLYSLIEKINNIPEIILTPAVTELASLSDLNSTFWPIADEYVGAETSSNYTKSISIDVSPGDRFIIYGKANGVSSRTYAVADVNGLILERHPRLEVVDNLPLWVTIPAGGVKLYINNSVNSHIDGGLQNNFSLIGGRGLNALTLGAYHHGIKLQQKTLPLDIDWDGSVKNNFSLCWVKQIKDANKIPFGVGYFFTDYPHKNGRLYFSNSLDYKPIEVLDFDDGDFGSSTDMASRVVAVSPKHGSVITSVFDVSPGTGLHIYEGGVFAVVNKAEPMQGWLYNVGIEFMEDEHGNEFCIYGEYSHASKATRRVFKGEYPYIDPDNWKVVHTFPSDGSAGSISHIHCIQKDPFSDFLYCVTGDTPAQSKILYSSDLGETWTVLIENQATERLRTVNIVFLSDYIYYGTDSTTHDLMRASRDVNGLMDASSLSAIHPLPEGQATNATVYLKDLNILVFLDRTASSRLWLVAFDILKNRVFELGVFDKIGSISGYWGHRGKCYNHFPNSSENKMIMGVSPDLNPVPFDLVGNDGNTFGSILYEITRQFVD